MDRKYIDSTMILSIGYDASQAILEVDLNLTDKYGSILMCQSISGMKWNLPHQ